MLCTNCRPQEDHATSQHWYKGNTHSHTSLCDHADSPPDTVARWYLDHGYNFLILSEHDLFIDPKTVNLPEDRREDFILIPGQELSAYNHVHTTAMNITRELRPHTHGPDGKIIFEDSATMSNVGMMQLYVDSTQGAGGTAILNHPNYWRGIPARDIRQVEELELFELYNGHPHANNWGASDRPSMEQKWDSLLTSGKRIFAVSADDSHYFKRWAPRLTNPGRGWVMVQSAELSADAITDAMRLGQFYASNGVLLKFLNTTNGSYEIEVDTQATFRTIAQAFVVGNRIETADEGFTIEFITDGGALYETIDGIDAKIALPDTGTYVRAKVIYTVRQADFYEEFYAWTQPVFLRI